jgi:hypothetical protein
LTTPFVPHDVVGVWIEIEEGGDVRGFDELPGQQVVEFLLLAARNLLLAGGPWNSRWGGPEGREKGVAGEKGTSGKTEMLKTETLKGRMLGGRPRSGGTRGFWREIHWL